MGEIHILVANEPRTYREVLAHALRNLRPQTEGGIAEPEELDAGIRDFRPHLVVSSRGCTAVQDGVLTWMTLYPGDDNRAEVVTAGGRAMLVGIQFDHFLSIVDGTKLLYRFGRGASQILLYAPKCVEADPRKFGQPADLVVPTTKANPPRGGGAKPRASRARR